MGSRYILMKMMMASLVTRDAVKEFAGMRYGFLVVDRRTHTNAFQSSTAYVCSSYPKLTKATESHSTAASKPASGVSTSRAV